MWAETTLELCCDGTSEKRQLAWVYMLHDSLPSSYDIPKATSESSESKHKRSGSFRKLGVPYFAVLIIRILLFMALY